MTNLNAPGLTAEPAALGTNQDRGLNLLELLGIALAFWPLVLACAVLGFLLGRYQAFIAEPEFVTDALVQTSVTVPEIAIGDLIQGIERGTPRETEIALLRSRSIMGDVVDQRGLTIRLEPEHWELLGQEIGAAYARSHQGPGFGEPPRWLSGIVASGFDWGGSAASVPTFELPDEYLGRAFSIVTGADGTYTLELPGTELSVEGRVGELLRVPLGGNDQANALALFVRELSAPRGTRFSLVRIHRDIAVRQLQARFSARAGSAQGMVELSLRGQDPEEATRTLDVILQTYLARNVEQRSEQAQQTLAFLDRQLPALRERVETAEAELNRFRIERGTADLTSETSAILQRSLELEQERTRLQQRREEVLQRFTENHPVIAAIDSQLAQNASLIARVDERVDELPEIQRMALSLQRESGLATELYTELLNRKQEFEMVRAGTTGTIRIIDHPVVPRWPVGAGASSIIARGAGGGLFVGLGLVFLIYLLRTGVEDPTKVEDRLNLPTYGSIPFSSTQVELVRRLTRKAEDSARLLAEIEPSSVTIEAVRSLRTALRFAQFDAANNLIMVTSPSPSVGKSFLSMNLGAMMAASGERVVVVDADLRRGRLHNTVGFERAPGLSELISNDESEESVVRRTSVSNLYLVSTGTLPPNPSEMLINEAFLTFVNALSERFDQVIVDTPPVLAVTEAVDIGRHCGTTIVVLKSGVHPMRMIVDTVERLRSNGVRVRGTVFNQVGRTRSARYAYSYGYGRGYYYAGYRYAYGSDKPKSAGWIGRTVRSAVDRVRGRLSA